jgi:hypothetical protein
VIVASYEKSEGRKIYFAHPRYFTKIFLIGIPVQHGVPEVGILCLVPKKSSI